MGIIRIKICGITQYEDAKTAVSLGVDALGFVFHPASPRYIPPEEAADIIRRLPPFVSRVGVFVNATAEAIAETIARTGIDTVQLHGDETPEFAVRFGCAVVKAFGVGPGFDLGRLAQFAVSGFLLDTWSDVRGGSGRTFDWSIARRATQLHPNIIIAGGLNPSNIRDALDNVTPYAVEFNSGVEIRPGIKNQYKMRDAVAIVKACR